MQCLSYFNELNSCTHNPEQKEVLLVFTYGGDGEHMNYI